MKKETIKKIRNEMLDAVWDERDIIVDEPVTPEEFFVLKSEWYASYSEAQREKYPGGSFELTKDLHRVCLIYNGEIIDDGIHRPIK